MLILEIAAGVALAPVVFWLGALALAGVARAGAAVADWIRYDAAEIAIGMVMWGLLGLPVWAIIGFAIRDFW